MRALRLIASFPAAVHGFLRLSSFRQTKYQYHPVERRSLCRPRHVIHLHASSPLPEGNSCYNVVVGLNKYSHDAAVCVLRERDGSLVFAGEKERLTRKKHDGGDTSEIVQHALDSIGASLDDIKLVVSNNHHHRVVPFERRIPWAVAQNIYPSSFAAPHNLVPNAAHAELSHHLAHAWSAVALAPFDRGLIIVMDGMGESYGAMAKAEAAMRRDDARGESDSADSLHYYNDLRLMREVGRDGEPDSNPGFQQVPEALEEHEAYREAESAYVFSPGSGRRPDGLLDRFQVL